MLAFHYGYQGSATAALTTTRKGYALFVDITTQLGFYPTRSDFLGGNIVFCILQSGFLCPAGKGFGLVNHHVD